MATIAEFTIPAASFPLGSIFENHPDAEVELERVVPTDNALIPYIWIHELGEVEEEQVEAAFADHPDVERVLRIDEVDGSYLCRVEWGPGYRGILQAITETGVVLISGFGTADEWTFEVRAEERDAIAEFQQYCNEHELPVTLRALHSLAQMETGAEYDLTDTQREALVLAFEQGYYDLPREVTLDEIAAELGITGQSLGSRLRRGTHRLIGSTLVPPYK